MKQKLLFILTLLVLCVTGAWAEDATWTYTFVSSDQTTINNNSNVGTFNGKTWTVAYSGYTGSSGDPSLGYSNSALKVPNSNNVEYVTFTTPSFAGKKIKEVIVNEKNSNSGTTKGALLTVFVDGEALTPESGNTTSLVNTTTATDMNVTSTSGTTCNSSLQIKLAQNGNSSNYIQFYVKSITVKYVLEAPESPTFSPDGGSVRGLSLVNLSSSGDNFYYQWSDTETTLTKDSEGWISGSSISVPNVDGTKYLYAYSSNGTGYESSVVHKAFTISSVHVLGLTQELDGTNKTVGGKTWTGIDTYVACAVSKGSKIDDIENNGSIRNVYLNATAYDAKAHCWKKNANNTYEDQNLGYTLTVASGKALNLYHIDARVLVGDNTYNWYAEIINNSGETIYTTNESPKTVTTSDTTTPSLSADLSLEGLTGTIKVYVWVKQNGSTKYFVVDKLTVNAELVDDDTPSYTVTTSVDDIAHGSVTETADYLEGTDAVITATSNAAYKFVNWTVDGVAQEGIKVDDSHFTYTIASIDAAHTVVANFTARKSISYNVNDGSKGTTGTGLGTEYADVDDKFTAPANYYIAKDGYTLASWTDGTNTYTPGTEYTLTENITLQPVFTANNPSLSSALSAIKTDAEVTWSFNNNGGEAPVISVEGATGYYVQQATLGGKPYDIVMAIDNTTGSAVAGVYGKTYNVGRANAQMRYGSKLTIPAVSGMTIVAYSAGGNFLAASEGDNHATTVGGVVASSGTGTTTATWVYEGVSTTIDYVAGNDANYVSKIVVTYPAPTYTVTYSAGDGTGTVPTETSKNEDEVFTLAGLKEGSLVAPTGMYLAGWNDGTNDYALGETYTMPGENVTLTAQWATGAEVNHYHYSYKDATHYNGTAFTDPLGNAAVKTGTSAEDDNRALANGNLCSSLGGITSVAISSVQYDCKDSYMNAYLKIAKGGSAKITITIADGYVGTLTMKAGGYSNNPTVSVSDATKVSGTVGGVATVEDNYNTLVYTLASGAHDITCTSNNMYISEMDIVAERTAVTVTIPSSGWGTYCCSSALDFSDEDTEILAYAVSAFDAGNLAVTYSKQTGVVPAGTGLLLYGEAGTKTIITSSETGTAPTINKLQGFLEATPYTADGDTRYLGMSGGSWKVMNAGTIPANKAVLAITSSELATVNEKLASGAKFSVIFDDDQTTKFSNLNANENINNDAPMYNLAGQKVSESYKGIVIVNGKKVVRK